MATRTGRTGVVQQGANAAGEVKSFEVDIQNETVDDTAMGDLWRTKKPMHNSWSGTVNFHYDPEDTDQNAFAQGSEFIINLFCDTDASGGAQLSGSCIITGRRIASAQEDIVSLDVTFEGNGALTESIVA